MSLKSLRESLCRGVDLSTLCDIREDCCGVPACLNAGTWFEDPYVAPVMVTTPVTQAHMHSEPVCAWPDCQTYLTRAQVATIRKAQR